MAERDLMRFLDKVTQLKQLVDSLEAEPHRREQLAGCSSHNQVVQLANSWGYEIGRRWGEPEPSALKSDNLLLSPLPETGEELERVLHCGNGWRLVLITSNEACCPEGLWMDQVEHEWMQWAIEASGEVPAVTPPGPCRAQQFRLFGSRNPLGWRQRHGSNRSLAERARRAGSHSGPGGIA